MKDLKTTYSKINGGANPFAILQAAYERKQRERTQEDTNSLPEIDENDRVYIRRQPKDWRVGYVSQSEIDGLHWDTLSGGVRAVSPQPFIHGYVSCDRIRGEFGHSCVHGEGPHRIKVMLTKKDNSKQTFEWAQSWAGPKPSKRNGGVV
jgi:hypothetical protein